MKDKGKSIIKRIVIAVTILVIIGALPVIQTGNEVYKDQLISCKKFEQVEKKIAAKNIESMKQGFIGVYIFSFMGEPSPTLALNYSSVPFNSLHATVDSTGVILKNYSNIGSYTCKRASYLNIDFVTYWIMISLVLIPIFVFKNKSPLTARLNFLTAVSKYWKSTLAKFIYITAVMAVMLVIVFGMYAINGIKLTRPEALNIMAYFLFLLVFQLFVLVSATLAWTAKRRVLCSIVIIVIWAVSIFLFGYVIPKMAGNSNDSFQSDDLNSQKNNTYIDFENYASKILSETPISDRDKISSELLKKYLENLRSFRDSEIRLIDKLKKDIKNNSLSRLYNPFIYLMGSHGDIGSLGYQSYLYFYKEVIYRQYEIALQYYKRVLEKKSDIKVTVFNPIIKLESRLPHYFFTALLIYAGLLILFITLVYVPFKRLLFQRVTYSFKNLKLAAKKGEYILLRISAGIEDFVNKLIDVLFNREKFDGEITIDGESITKKKVFYLPDLSADDMQELAHLSGGKLPGKPFKELNFEELCALFPQIKSSDVLLLDRTSLHIGPQDGIVIIEINPEIPRRTYTKLDVIIIDEDGFRKDIEKDE